jgi:hypothetical protein
MWQRDFIEQDLDSGVDVFAKPEAADHSCFIMFAISGVRARS